jgi:hypothetical protein
MTSAQYDLLGLINLCDNFSASSQSLRSSQFISNETLVPWVLDRTNSGRHVVGLLRPAIISLLKNESTGAWDLSHVSNPDCPYVSFAASIDTHSKCSAVLKELCERWRDQGVFSDIIGPRKWRNELYCIYADPFGRHDYPSTNASLSDDTNYIFEMERSACALFGVVTYGVHMTIYKETADGDVEIWTPTRSKTKKT